MVNVISLVGVPTGRLRRVEGSLGNGTIVEVSGVGLVSLTLRSYGTSGGGLISLSGRVRNRITLVTARVGPFGLCGVLRSDGASTPTGPKAVTSSSVIMPTKSANFRPNPFLNRLRRTKVPTGVSGNGVYMRGRAIIMGTNRRISGRMTTALSEVRVGPVRMKVSLGTMCRRRTVCASSVLTVSRRRALTSIRGTFEGTFGLSMGTTVPASRAVSAVVALTCAETVGINITKTVVASRATRPVVNLTRTGVLTVTSRITSTPNTVSSRLTRGLSGITMTTTPMMRRIIRRRRRRRRRRDDRRRTTTKLKTLFNWVGWLGFLLLVGWRFVGLVIVA